MKNKEEKQEEMVLVPRKLLKKAGKLASFCRILTGGSDINGFTVPSVDVNNFSRVIREIRTAVDDYDALMVAFTLKQ